MGLISSIEDDVFLCKTHGVTYRRVFLFYFPIPIYGIPSGSCQPKRTEDGQVAQGFARLHLTQLISKFS